MRDDLGRIVELIADDAVVGVMQLTAIPGISRNGRRLVEHAHDWGRARGCTLAQLTSDEQRPDAHQCYASVGYAASHEGL